VYTGQTGSNSPASNQTAGKATQQGSVGRPSDVSPDGGSLPDGADPAGAFPRLYGYEVVRELPHQADAFTQGLEFDKRCAKTAAGDGFECTDIFWESTGALACHAMPMHEPAPTCCVSGHAEHTRQTNHLLLCMRS